MQHVANTTSPRFLSVTACVEQGVWPGSEASLRWALFHRASNGLDACVRRLGRKIVLSVDELNNWLDRQKEAA
ncbi:hypothetical protein KQI52_00020 [bacterium]|nr:hypothetical protein [bacterium]